MKNVYITLAAIALLAVPFRCIQAACAQSRTFFAPRQITFDSTYELALANYDMYHPADCCDDAPWLHVYVSPFFQKSTNKKALAQYFLPQNKCGATLREDGSGDINPEWVGLFGLPGNNINETFSFRPTRRVAGALLTMRFDLANWCQNKLWLSVNTAAMQAEHNLNPCINPSTTTPCPAAVTVVPTLATSQGGSIGGITNFCQAFGNPNLQAGRISCCELKRSGLDDIQVKFGYD